MHKVNQEELISTRTFLNLAAGLHEKGGSNGCTVIQHDRLDVICDITFHGRGHLQSQENEIHTNNMEDQSFVPFSAQGIHETHHDFSVKQNLSFSKGHQALLAVYQIIRNAPQLCSTASQPASNCPENDSDKDEAEGHLRCRMPL